MTAVKQHNSYYNFCVLCLEELSRSFGPELCFPKCSCLLHIHITAIFGSPCKVPCHLSSAWEYMWALMHRIASFWLETSLSMKSVPVGKALKISWYILFYCSHCHVTCTTMYYTSKFLKGNIGHYHLASLIWGFESASYLRTLLATVSPRWYCKNRRFLMYLTKYVHAFCNSCYWRHQFRIWRHGCSQ